MIVLIETVTLSQAILFFLFKKITKIVSIRTVFTYRLSNYMKLSFG